MCGITGFVGMDDNNLLHDMCNSMHHRGPDDDGYYSAPDIGLAMCRLAVIDLETGGQPITNENRDVWVVFNGELYNYDSVRKELKKKGHRFRTASDTEIIVHLYEDYGLDFVHHLQGMFSIALWDEKRRRLVLARDRIGEKPLYYTQEDGILLFGSEIKTLLQWNIKREVESQSVCNFLALGYVSGNGTFFSDISKLPPGHLLIWEDGDVVVKRYWRYTISKKSEMSFSEAADNLATQLDETVQLCLKSDVEVGAFLSGGLDSSVIVALMRKHGARVKTFTVGYSNDVAGFSELHYAKKVADYLGTEHYELVLGAQSSIDLLPRILWHYDEPHCEPVSSLVYKLCEFTKKHVKVALSGTGSDEIFFGYPRHAGLYYLGYYHKLPAFLRTQVIERIVQKWPESTKGSRFAKRVKRFVSGAQLPCDEAYLTWVSLFHPSVRARMLSQQTKINAVSSAGDAFLREYLMGSNEVSLLGKISQLDINGYLPEYQLTEIDRMSMAHGLEVRSPFCDYKFVEHVTSLPNNYRLKRSRSKHILKYIAKQWLPRTIVERKKVGFDSPIGQWFKGELKSFLKIFLSCENVNRSGLLDGGEVQKLVENHLSGRSDYSLQLWGIIAIETWYRMYIEDRVTNGLDYSLKDLRGAGVIASN